jgi:predicted alpha/beta superfamily hydrolase
MMETVCLPGSHIRVCRVHARSYNYLPFPPGTGIGNFRDDAARWPGGGAEEFLGRVQHELLPMLQHRYNLAQASIGLWLCVFRL